MGAGWGAGTLSTPHNEGSWVGPTFPDSFPSPTCVPCDVFLPPPPHYSPLPPPSPPHYSPCPPPPPSSRPPPLYSPHTTPHPLCSSPLPPSSTPYRSGRGVRAGMCSWLHTYR